MELSQLLIIGALAGSLAGTVNGLGWRILGMRAEAEHDPWRTQPFSQQVIAIAIHLFAGLGIGMLFWLSWGFAALVGVSWWMRGILFALTIWGVVYLPILALQLLTLRLPWSVAFWMALETLLTMSAAGVACGWTWAKGP